MHTSLNKAMCGWRDMHLAWRWGGASGHAQLAGRRPTWPAGVSSRRLPGDLSRRCTLAAYLEAYLVAMVGHGDLPVAVVLIPSGLGRNAQNKENSYGTISAPRLEKLLLVGT
jgi:hypothetical protein